MPSLTLDNCLIWFAHCPKAGGTSVETAMVATWGDRVGHLHWGWDQWWKRGGWRRADPPNSPQHLTWADAQAFLPRAPDAVFAMVRDPAARMVSEYRYQRSRRRGTRLGRALACLPFAFWLRLMLAMAAKNPHGFDNHFRPQGAFVPDGAAIFRLEDGLEAPLAWLAETSRTAVPTPPHRLKSGTGPLPIGAREAALIAAVFAEDYARFGYPAPSVAPLAAPLVAPWASGGLDRLAGLLAPALVWLDRRGRL